MSTTFSEQEAFWSKVTRRRSPEHPAVIAFAAAKLRLLRSVIPGEGLTMLEVGAGNGYLSRCFAEAFDLTALDFAQNMLDQNPLPAARKVVGRAEALPFPERSFDVVFCGNLLHHLEEPIVAVREMARVTRRYVALLEPNITNPAMFLFGALKRAERGSLKFTPGYVRRLGAQAGLRLRASFVQGAVLPNKTPRLAVPLARLLDFPNPLGFYTLAIFERP
jgi:SAM-dependent methyltransferase